MSGKGQMRGQIYVGENTIQDIISRTGKRLGYYHKVNDQTFDSMGNYVGRGDQRMLLFERDED